MSQNSSENPPTVSPPHKQPSSWLKRVPNQLTLVRIGAIPILLLIYPLSKSLGPLCGIIFALAALTDMLDGWVARRYGHVTPMGALLDPIADKMLIAAALLLLVSSDAVPVFLAGILICRDIGINGLRMLALEQRIALEVRDAGKWKTIFQSIGIFCLFFYKPLFGIRFREIGMLCIWAAVLFSLYSAWAYTQSYWEKFKEIKTSV